MRLLIYGVTMFLGIAIKTGWFRHVPEGRISQTPTLSDSVRQGGNLRAAISNANPRPVDSLASTRPYPDVGPEDISSPPADYKAIEKRNVFGLIPVTAVGPPPAVAVEPKQDLVLTGLAGLGAAHCALFMVTEPGKAPSYFALHEGEQNEWLEVRSIDMDRGTVKALLKQPVMRIRNAETEVVLSFRAHGARH